jgi:hypothetical protein
MSKKNKTCKYMWAVVALALIVAVLSILYGQGYLNLGAVSRTKKVAQAVCLEGSDQEGTFCTYTISPIIHYMIIKDGSDDLIYDSVNAKMATIIKDNGLDLQDGKQYDGSAYTLTTGSQWTDIKLTYKLKDGSVPAFVLDRATADAIKEAKSVIVELPKNVKIRFNDIKIL